MLAYRHPMMNDETNNDGFQDTDGFDPMEVTAPKGRMGATLAEGEGILKPDEARAFAQAIGTELLSDKCEDVVILDVTRISPITGFIVIGSGTSARQMRSALTNLGDVAKDFGTSTYQTSEDDSAIWLLADFIDVVVHLFEPNARAHHDLEMLWGDAPRIDVPRPEPKAKPGLGNSQAPGDA